MRRQIIEDNVRVDGRKLDEVRPFLRVGILPKRVHTGFLTGIDSGVIRLYSQHRRCPSIER